MVPKRRRARRGCVVPLRQQSLQRRTEHVRRGPAEDPFGSGWYRTMRCASSTVMIASMAESSSPPSQADAFSPEKEMQP